MNFIDRTNKLKFIDGKGNPILVHFLNLIVNKMQFQYIKKVKVGKLNTDYREEKLIVSLTTFPKRINAVTYSIKSIFNQTYIPDRVVLWLSGEQFDYTVPSELENLIMNGLEVKFCDDLKSHKKYYYSLLNQKKDELVITIDDDLLYSEKLIENLVKKHEENPNTIICTRARTVCINNDEYEKYEKWKCYSDVGTKKPSFQLMPSTGAGTLYPQNSLADVAFDKELIINLALYTDDLWIKFVSTLNNTKIIKISKEIRYLSNINIDDDERLLDRNVIENGNDINIAKLDKVFPIVKQKILEEIKRENINDNYKIERKE